MIRDEQLVAKPTQFPPTKETQDLLLEHVRRINQFFNKTCSLRTRMEQIDRAYQREDNQDGDNLRAKQANRYGDKSKLQDMTIPIIQPQVDSMQAYLAGVFLTGTPLFGMVAGPEAIDAALMYETILDENSKHGAWVREFSIFFKDMLKYNIGGVEADWKQETVYQIDGSAVAAKGDSPKQKSVLWEGNTVRRLDLYNSVWDTRVAPAKLHEHGEFAGFTEPMSATRLKQFIQDLNNRIASNVNGVLTGAVDFSRRGNAAGGKYYVPSINPEPTVPQGEGIDWFQIAGLTSTDSNKLPTINAVSTYYLRIIPEHFKMKVPSRGNPQIWKLVIVNDAHIIYLERITNMHNWLPIIMAQPLEDGLNYQTKSYAMNGEVFQDAATTIWNASLAAQRRAVYDRIFYDPSRIRKEDINNSNPIARIPVKSNAYGKPVSEAYSHASFTNDQFSVVGQQLSMINSMANVAQGSNLAQQGQFVKGNKTKHEYADVMGHSNDRQQTIALFLESQFFYPLKQILKLNIMQYSSTGSIYNYEKKKKIDIDPMQLRTASLEFEVSDGMLPTDRIISAEVMQALLQYVSASPDLQVEFDLIGMLLYHFKTQGARNIDQFRRTPEQQAARMQQMQQTAAATQPQQQQQPMMGGQ